MTPGAGTWQRYGAFLRRRPEISLAWHDRPTGARGWLVINSLRGGAAGGGTRMRRGAEIREVVYLAKAMELKFALSGPPVGGAKAAIDFDPRDPRKTEVLARWYEAIAPHLRHHFGTGGDLNVDEVVDVIPCCSGLGLRHPQEGIVRGHVRPDPERFDAIIHALDSGVRAEVCDAHGLEGRQLTVSDVVTGYGVAAAIRHLTGLCSESLHGARVLLEGFGNVGGACALYLARAGARIVGIRDAEKAVIDAGGLALEEVESLLRRRRRGLLPADPRTVRGAEAGAFWNTPADIFVCAALSGTVAPNTLEQLARAGVRILACGANQPFREARLGVTRVQRIADRRFAVIPDILANCGMARTFSYLMDGGAEAACDSILAAVDDTITATLDEVLDRAGGAPRNLLAATLDLALDRVEATSSNP